MVSPLLLGADRRPCSPPGCWPPAKTPECCCPRPGRRTFLLLLLWLLAAVGLAGWRLWSRRGDWRGGVVEAALLLAVVLVFVAAEMAGYKHPARHHRLGLAVRCSSSSASSASWPSRRATARRCSASFWPGPRRCRSRPSIRPPSAIPASATFAQPAPFAAWLALFLPGLLAAVARLPSRPHRRAGKRSSPPFSPCSASSRSSRPCLGLRTSRTRRPPLLDLWARDGQDDPRHPGSASGRATSRAPSRASQGPNGGAVVADPHNFVLEIAATCGVVTLLAVLAALGAFFVKAVGWLRKPPAPADAPRRNRSRRAHALGVLRRRHVRPGARLHHPPDHRRPDGRRHSEGRFHRLRPLPRLADRLRAVRARPLVRPASGSGR